MADMKAKGRSYWTTKTHCPKGHPLSGKNLYINPVGARCCRACANLRYAAKRLLLDKQVATN